MPWLGVNVITYPCRNLNTGLVSHLGELKKPRDITCFALSPVPLL